jgi:hypothetical protein
MYYPQDPREPSGCAQTVTITRMMLGILLVPIALIMAAVLAVLLTFYALTVHPLLALLVILLAAATILGLARWESRRAARDTTHDE